MNLHEYQAKEILKAFQVPVQDGIVAETINQATEAYKKITEETGSKFAVIKAQIHAGGRGKGKIENTEQRGVCVVKSLEEATQAATNLLSNKLITIQTGPKGKIVNKIFVAKDAYTTGPAATQEFYLSMLLDRAKGEFVIIYSTEGGVDIEKVAHETPDKIFKEWINPTVGLANFQLRDIAFNLGLKGEAAKSCQKFVANLYKAFINTDCSLLEINPLFKNSQDQILAVDCKMSIEDNALIRHPELEAIRDLSEEDPIEIEAGKYNLNFIKLDGNVGCMVNGAGLAMATMDIIKLSGGDPANFLDVGGGANAQTVEAGFRIILKEPNVKAILINIFGGIVRCDKVANGVIEAYKKIGNINIPIIARLQGNSAELAKELLDKSGLKVVSAIELEDAAKLVTQALL
ncbi:MAG: ADP-forming succinate--CoA ligase subunit beta [Alphaproteobacteria bacterium]|nr:ADP-forming succinate--CoA ligase subunit beta [Alphaproteobacteria bacterium]